MEEEKDKRIIPLILSPYSIWSCTYSTIPVNDVRWEQIFFHKFFFYLSPFFFSFLLFIKKYGLEKLQILLWKYIREYKIHRFGILIEANTLISSNVGGSWNVPFALAASFKLNFPGIKTAFRACASCERPFSPLQSTVTGSTVGRFFCCC